MYGSIETYGRHGLGQSPTRVWILGSWLVLLAGAPLWAHDFWLQPAQFHFEKPGPLKVYAYIGDHFEGDRIIPSPQLVDAFQLMTPTASRDLIPGIGTDIAGVVALKEPGIAVVAYRGKRSHLRLAPAKFEAYLAEEGLDDIIRQRRETGRTKEPGNEVYSRCAKALICTGDAGAAEASDYGRTIGHTLELVPLTNPLALNDEQVLRMKLLFRGTPLADKRVTAYCKDLRNRPVVARTNAAGEVTLPLNRAGIWMVKAVHMVPLEAPQEVDWESFWASFTFETKHLKKNHTTSH